MAWSETENDVAIAAYFNLLVAVFNGESVNKKAVYRRVSSVLGNRRNAGSVERKFQNYSYVLARMGLPYTPGLKPQANIQWSLVPTLVEEYIADHDPFSKIRYPSTVPDERKYLDRAWTSLIDAVPPPMGEDGPPVPHDPARVRKIDFAGRDARNRALGRAGEEFVVEIQRRILIAADQPDLARSVEHVALHGDGDGYDVASYYPDGRERLIEVKTTPLRRTTPFYLTANELRASHHHADAFELHRVYDWGRDPRIFILPPPLDERVHLDPVQYRARF